MLFSLFVGLLDHYTLEVHVAISRQEHEVFFDVVKNFDAIIVRCNPGQIKADGGLILGVDEVTGTFKGGFVFGGPYHKASSILGSILGPPRFGKLPHGLGVRFRVCVQEC